jgi:hypothetical protein
VDLNWLIRSLERAQSLFRLPSGTILGVELDTLVHFSLTLAIVAFAMGRDRMRLGLGIAAGLALVKEGVDVTILLHYNDVDRFVPDILMDLLAAAVAIGVGVWIGGVIRTRRTPSVPGSAESG